MVSGEHPTDPVFSECLTVFTEISLGELHHEPTCTDLKTGLCSLFLSRLPDTGSSGEEIQTAADGTEKNNCCNLSLG